MKKEFIKAKANYNLDDDGILDGTIDEVIDKLKVEEDRFRIEGWKNLYIKPYHEYEYSAIQIWGERLETDEELEKRRIKLENKMNREQKKIDKRRKQYEELKREFEK